MPGKRTPRTWQWAVRTRDGYVTSPRWGRESARIDAAFRRGRIDADASIKVVKVEVRELPAARQRRGR
jgi:hypothetical protein